MSATDTLSDCQPWSAIVSSVKGDVTFQVPPFRRLRLQTVMLTTTPPAHLSNLDEPAEQPMVTEGVTSQEEEINNSTKKKNRKRPRDEAAPSSSPSSSFLLPVPEGVEAAKLEVRFAYNAESCAADGASGTSVPDIEHEITLCQLSTRKHTQKVQLELPSFTQVALRVPVLEEAVSWGGGRNQEVNIVVTGMLLPQAQQAWRPVLHRKWYVVNDESFTCDVSPAVNPPSNLSKSERQAFKKMEKSIIRKRQELLRPGAVVTISAIANNDSMVLWPDGTMTPKYNVTEYRKEFTPRSKERIVRIRRFPHRDADIIGEVPFGTFKEAIGRVLDTNEGEYYVIWADGGFSRTSGTSGPFLLEKRAAMGCTPLDPPKWFMPCREDEKGVRVREAPDVESRQIGQLEPNELREAVALHGNTEDGSVYVEWVAGGFSRMNRCDPDVQYLGEVALRTGSTRNVPLRRPRPTPPSPDIVDLTTRRKQRQHLAQHGSGGKNAEDALSSMEPSPMQSFSAAAAANPGNGDGNMKFEDLPRVHLGGGSRGSSSSGDGEHSSSSSGGGVWDGDEGSSSDGGGDDFSSVFGSGGGGFFGFPAFS